MGTRKSDYGELGKIIEGHLEAAKQSARWLASEMELPPPYLWQIMTKRRSASPALIDKMAAKLGIPEGGTIALHRAACRDLGYKVEAD